MTFRLVVSNTVTALVEGKRPNSDGSFSPFSFKVIAETRNQEEIEDVLTRFVARELNMSEFLRGVIRGWSSVLDENGNQLDFTPAGLDALLNLPGMSLVIFASYNEACGVKGKQKN